MIIKLLMFENNFMKKFIQNIILKSNRNINLLTLQFNKKKYYPFFNKSLSLIPQYFQNF